MKAGEITFEQFNLIFLIKTEVKFNDSPVFIKLENRGKFKIK